MHRATPFLRLLVPWSAGIALGAWLDRPLPFLLPALAAGGCVVGALAWLRYGFRYRWVFGSVLAVVLLMAGYARIVWHNELRQSDHFSSQADTLQLFSGVVYDAPSRGARLKIPLRLDACGDDTLKPCTGNLLVLVEISPETGQIAYGDRLLLRGDIRPAEPPKNPDAFDYKSYLHFQNIHFQCFAKPDALIKLSSGNGNTVWRSAYACRDRLLNLLQTHFPGTDEYAVASALLVGYKDDLSDELRTAYADTGSMHALAVSGTHVGLLYAGLMFGLGRLPGKGRKRQILQTLILLFAIWGFSFLTGATASVLRASVMFSMYLLGKMLYRNASIWNVLAASAFCLLLYNPCFLFDAGFQLSYAAVAGMVFFYPYFQKSVPIPRGWLGEAWKILLIGIAAQIGTLPLSLYYFHQFPTYFWLAGWVVVLGGAIFLWGGAALVLLDWALPALAGYLGKSLYALVWGMNQLIFIIQKLPGSVASGIWIPGWSAVLLYGVIGLTALAILRREGRWLVYALGILTFLSVCRAGRIWRQSTQNQLVVYHINRQSLLDFIDGQSLWALSDSLPQRYEKFAAQAHRWALGVRNTTPAGFDTVICTTKMLYDPPFVQFGQMKLVVLEDAHWLETGVPPPLPVDVVILRGNPRIQLSDCLRRFPCRLVVADASNSWKKTEYWKQQCRSAGIAFHDVRESGAWVGGQP